MHAFGNLLLLSSFTINGTVNTYSPVVEGGESPPREGIYATRCTLSIQGRRFRISMLFSRIGGRLKDMGAFVPQNGGNDAIMKKHAKH